MAIIIAAWSRKNPSSKWRFEFAMPARHMRPYFFQSMPDKHFKVLVKRTKAGAVVEGNWRFKRLKARG